MTKFFNSRKGRLFAVKGGLTEDDILAAAREIAQSRLSKGVHLGDAMTAKQALQHRFLGLTHEEFGLAMLDQQLNIIEFKVIFRGSTGEAAVWPREVAKECLSTHCASALICHNHPSGSQKPSEADIAITKRIKDTLDLIGVRLTDHIIVTPNQCFSFVENGYL